MKLKKYFQQLKDWYTNLTHPVITEHRLYKTLGEAGYVWKKVTDLLDMLGYPPLPDQPHSFGTADTHIELRLIITGTESVTYINLDISSRSPQEIRYVLEHLDRLSLLEKAL